MVGGVWDERVSSTKLPWHPTMPKPRIYMVVFSDLPPEPVAVRVLCTCGTAYSVQSTTVLCLTDLPHVPNLLCLNSYYSEGLSTPVSVRL